MLIDWRGIVAKELSTQAKWKPWKGFVLFVIVIVWMIVGSIIGAMIGDATIGTFILQLGFLGIAVITTLINKTPFKEVFPVKGITVRDFFGVILMWIGAMPLGLISALIIGQLAPDTFSEVASSVNSVATGMLILGFITTVICPPVCEESIMRGAIFSNFRGIKKDWVICLIIGIFFGIFHMDYVRFFNTALMGGCLAYLMCKRNNFILPMMYHFINNFVLIGISTLLTIAGQGASTSEVAVENVDPDAVAATTASMLPGMMIIAWLCPVILVIGIHLIKRQHEISEGLEPSGMKLGKKIALAFIPSVILLVAGIILAVNTFSQMDVGQLV